MAVLRKKFRTRLLLIMVGLHREVDLLMALLNALEKDVALRISFHLHGGTGPHLQSAHHVGLTTLVEGIFMRGIVIGKISK